jgi:hypothetical protein
MDAASRTNRFEVHALSEFNGCLGSSPLEQSGPWPDVSSYDDRNDTLRDQLPNCLGRSSVCDSLAPVYYADLRDAMKAQWRLFVCRGCSSSRSSLADRQREGPGTS